MLGITLVISAAFAVKPVFQKIPGCAEINHVDSSEDYILITCPGKLFRYTKARAHLDLPIDLGTVYPKLTCEDESKLRREVCWKELTKEDAFETNTGKDYIFLIHTRLQCMYF